MPRNSLFIVAFLIVIAALLKGRRNKVVLTDKTAIEKGRNIALRFPDTIIKGPPQVKKPFVETTGFMCDCDSGPYTAPIILNQVAFPLPPTPRFIYRPPNATPNSAPQLAQETYREFGLTNDFLFWHWGYAKAWRGSDGRIFLQSGSSPSLDVIGADEYKMKNGKIYYGPNVYTRVYSDEGYRTR